MTATPEGAKLFLCRESAHADLAARLAALLGQVLVLPRAQIQCGIVQDLAQIHERTEPAVVVLVLSAASFRGAPVGDWELLVRRQAPPAVIPLLLGGARMNALAESLKARSPIDGSDPTDLEQLAGRIARELGTTDPLDIAPHRRALRTIAFDAALADSGSLGHLRAVARRYSDAFVGLFCLGLILAVALWLASPRPDRAIFGFEQGVEGWRCEEGSGCLGTENTSEAALRGRRSLALLVKLDASSGRKARSLAGIPREIGRARKVTAWARAPEAAAGDQARPNGLRLFLQDAKSRRHYGAWTNVPVPEDWIELSVTAGTPKPEDHVDATFDNSTVDTVGISIEMGGGSDRGYEGVIYLDCVNW